MNNFKIFEKLKEPFTYTIIAAFAVLCSCFCITFSQFAVKEIYSGKTENIGVSSVLNSETIIHQEINVNGTVTELELQTDKISEGDNGSIEILLKHPNGRILKSFSLNEIFKNKQKILLKLPSHIVGPLDLYVSGTDIVTPVVFNTRSEKLLGQYDINGIVQPGNIYVVVKTSVIPRYTYLRICLLIVMSITFGFHIYMNHCSKCKPEKWMYWLAIIYIFCTICVRHPVRTLLAEPCWETLTNFSHQTLTRGIQGSFFLDDAGYWPLLPRLISFVIVILFQQKKYTGVIYAIICLSIIVALTAEFVKNKYDKYIFLEARFMLSLLMGATCYLEISQMLFLHNIAYMGIFVIIFAYMNDLESMAPYKRTCLYLITFLFTCSKPQYIGLIPLLFLLIVTKGHQIKTKKIQYSFVCCIGPLLQIVYLISNIAEDPYPVKRSEGLFHNIFETCYTYVQSYVYFFENYVEKARNSGLFINIVIALILLFILFKLITLHKNNRSVFCIMLFLWGLGITFSNAITGRLAQTVNISYIISATSYVSRREEFLVYVGILFFCVFIVSNHFLISYDVKWKKLILSIILILCVCRFSKNMVGSTELEARTNWKIFASMVEKPEYAIPVGQRDSFITQNADVIYYGQRKLGKQIVRQSQKVTEENQIDAIMLSALDVGNTVKDNGIVSVYASKMYISQPQEIYIALFDNNGNTLAYTRGMAEYDRSIIGFQFEKKIYGVSHIGFYCSLNGTPYVVKPEVFITVAHEEHN